MTPMQEMKNALRNMHSGPRTVSLAQFRSYLYEEIRRCLVESPVYLPLMIQSLRNFTEEELSPAIDFLINFQPLSSENHRTRYQEYLESLPYYTELLNFWLEKHFTQLNPDNLCRIFRIRCCNLVGGHTQDCETIMENFLNTLAACL